MNGTAKAQYAAFREAMLAMTPGQASAVFVVCAGAFLVSLITDRLAYLVFSLLYLLIALGTTLGETSRFPPGAGSLTAMAMLGAIGYWTRMRNALLRQLPLGLRAQLLRPEEG